MSTYVEPAKVQDPGFTPRSEFQQSPQRSTPFGLLSLHGTSSIRGLGFSTETYAAILDAIKMEWSDGVEYATNNEGDGWRCVLNGNPWKKDGKEELESIRLILAILTTLATQGWMLKHEIQVGSSKKDTHSFVFSYKERRNQDDDDGGEEEEEVPDFFALTFPLPDRISVVDPPSISTPAIISSIRTAIVSSPTTTTSHAPSSPFHPNSSSSIFTSTTSNSHNPKLRKTVPPISNSHSVKIKEEGWVTDGVYSFTIGGYKGLLGGVKDVKYDNSQPTLLLALLHNLDTHHFGLTTSIPLLPFKKRRDILFFHSLPSRPSTRLRTRPNTPVVGSGSKGVGDHLISSQPRGQQGQGLGLNAETAETTEFPDRIGRNVDSDPISGSQMNAPELQTNTNEPSATTLTRGNSIPRKKIPEVNENREMAIAARNRAALGSILPLRVGDEGVVHQGDAVIHQGGFMPLQDTYAPLNRSGEIDSGDNGIGQENRNDQGIGLMIPPPLPSRKGAETSPDGSQFSAEGGEPLPNPHSPGIAIESIYAEQPSMIPPLPHLPTLTHPPPILATAPKAPSLVQRSPPAKETDAARYAREARENPASAILQAQMSGNEFQQTGYRFGTKGFAAMDTISLVPSNRATGRSGVITDSWVVPDLSVGESPNGKAEFEMEKHQRLMAQFPMFGGLGGGGAIKPGRRPATTGNVGVIAGPEPRPKRRRDVITLVGRPGGTVGDGSSVASGSTGGNLTERPPDSAGIDTRMDQPTFHKPMIDLVDDTPAATLSIKTHDGPSLLPLVPHHDPSSPTKFVEQFRDTLEIPEEWIGDPVKGKAMRDSTEAAEMFARINAAKERKGS